MKTDTRPRLLIDESLFEQWKKTLHVPKKTAGFSSLSEQYITQREYRQNKEKYKLIEYLPFDIKMELTEKFKLKTPVYESRTLAIDVGDKSVRRACLFMDYLIEKLKELGASVDVEQARIQTDNTVIHWEGVKLFCSLTEQTIRHRNRSVAPTGDMTPPYEKIPTGEFTLTFYNEESPGISFADDGDKRIEDRIQEIFTGFRTYILPLKKVADEKKEREHQEWEAAQKRWELQKAAEEAEKQRKKLQEYKKQIYSLMTIWEQRKRAKEYVEELTNNLSTLPEAQQKKITKYCEMVLQLYSIENQYQEILDFIS